MENLNYFSLAIPAFFAFVLIEYIYAKHKRKPLFNYEGSVANISIGIAERLINLFIASAFYGVFVWVYETLAIVPIPQNVWGWIGIFLATDFVWYWYHRLGHQVNLFWAAHIVHHQSEEYNYTVSARITTIQSLVRTVFWCVLPLVGFHPKMVIIMLVIHGAYSFFTHTELIPKNKWIEKVFITPSLHSVHHASDEKYLDKNYGDMFVFWDKLFGTFQEEEEKPKYGLTHPLKSKSFLWQHFHYYLEIWESFKIANSFKGKWLAVFGSPATMDQDIRPQLELKFLQHERHSTKKLRFRHYITGQMVLAALLLTGFTLFYNYADGALKAFMLSFIIITLINCGAIMEQRKWIGYLEYFRLFIILLYTFWIFDMTGYLIIPVLVLLLIEKSWHLSYKFQKAILQERLS